MNNTDADSDNLPCFNETQRFRKVLTGPRVAFIWSFPLVQEQNLTNCNLETCWNCLVGYSRQARMNGIAAQLPSASHSTVIHSCRHLFQADTADSERKAATQEHSTGEMLAVFYCLYILSSKYQINSQCKRRLLN